MDKDTERPDVFFLPCKHCYSKLVFTMDSLGKTQKCSKCNKPLIVKNYPKRNPMFAKIKESIAPTKQNPHGALTLKCTYCNFQIKGGPQHCGKKIHCNRCHFILEIPRLEPKKISLRASAKEIIANGENKIVLRAHVENENGVPIVNEIVHFEITHPNNKVSKASVKTGEFGRAIVNYTAGVLSGSAHIKIFLASNSELHAQGQVQEIQGIADGTLRIGNIELSSQDEQSAFLEGTIVLENPGKQPVALQSIQIHEQNGEQIEAWEQEYDDIILAEEQHKTIQFSFKKQQPHPIAQISLDILVLGKNLETSEKIKVQSTPTVEAEVKEPVWFKVQSSHNNREKAGMPFVLKCVAMRGDVQDHEYNSEIEISIHTNGKASPNGMEPKFPEQDTVIFENGEGKSQEYICLFRAEQPFLEVTFPHRKVSTIEDLHVMASSPDTIRLHLASPQNNEETLSGENYLEVIDVYGNIVEDFTEEMEISAPLLFETPKTVTATGGKAQIDSFEIDVVPDKGFPVEVEVTARWQQLSQTQKIVVHPTPAQIEITKFDCEKVDLEPGMQQQVSLEINNIGNADFRIDHLKIEFCEQQTRQPVAIGFLQEPLENIVVKGNEKVSVTTNITIQDITGEMILYPTIQGMDLFTEEIQDFAFTENTISWNITAIQRKFKISCAESLLAGTSFALEIQAECDGENDKNYHGSKQLQVTYHSAVDHKKSPEVPETISADFKEGKAKTDAVFCVFDPHALAIEIRDNAKDISGKLENIVVIPQDREFVISTDTIQTAGVAFSLTIEAQRNTELDPSYHGKKRLVVKYRSENTKSSAKIPDAIELQFESGKAITENLFTIFKPAPFTIEIEDPELGGATGNIANIQVVAGKLKEFVCEFTSPQTNHETWKGKHRITALDAYQNTVKNVQENVKISASKGNLSFSEDKFRFVEGILNLEVLRPKLSVSLEELNAPIVLEVTCGEIKSHSEVTIQPQAQKLKITEIHCEPDNFLPGESGNIEVTVENPGETSLEVSEVQCQFSQSDEIISHLQGSLQQSVTLAPKSSGKALLTLDVDEKCPEGDIVLCLDIVGQDLFYKSSAKVSGGNLVICHVDPAPIQRTIAIFCSDKIVAGEAFSVNIEVQRDQECDTSYNEKHTVSFALEDYRQDLVKAFPETLELLFEDGKATTAKEFCLLAAHPFKITATLADLEATADVSAQITTAPASAFQVVFAKEYVANQPFTEDITITVLDVFGNVKTDFQEPVHIKATGSGKLLYEEQPIKVTNFRNGVAILKGEKLCYQHPTLSKKEDLEISLRGDSLLQKYKTLVVPQPAKVIIESIQLSNTVVEWERSNYIVTLTVQHLQGSSIQPLGVKLLFVDKDTEIDGYRSSPQQTIPQIIEGGACVDLTFEVSLGKNIALGKHQIKAVFEAKDLHYGKSLHVEKISEESWKVEPSGRTIIASLPSKASAWCPFAIDLEVKLNGKTDTSYNGQHNILCSYTGDYPPGIPEPRIPGRLQLDFRAGKSSTEKEFIFFHDGKIKLEFYESEVGGVSGNPVLEIQKEPMGHVLQRKFREVWAFVQLHRQKIIALLAIVFVLSLFLVHWQQVTATQRLKIIEISGKVTVDSLDVVVGDVIYAQQDIQVSENGLCVMQMMNGTIIKLGGSSHLYTNDLGRSLLSSTYTPSLDVKQGDLHYQKNKGENPNIKIPDADKLDIDSSSFRLDVKKDRSLVAVYEGKIAITSGGETVDVNEGKGSSVEKGKAPAPPVALPEPPTWTMPELKPGEETMTIAKNSISLSWQKVANAAYYSVEVCNKDKFPIPLMRQVSVPTTTKVRNLENGDYKCQVSSYDNSGFPSKPSEPFEFRKFIARPTRELKVIAYSKTTEQELSCTLFLNGNAFKNGEECDLGKHHLKVDKDLYYSKDVEVNLAEENAPLILKVALEPKPRKIKWQLIPETFPDYTFTISKIVQNDEELQQLPTELVPDLYKFTIEIPGFQPYQSAIEIPVGQEEHKVFIRLLTAKRPLKYNITADYSIDNFAPLVQINEHTIDAVKPGDYTLQISHPGFHDIVEKIQILPGVEPVLIEKTLQAKPRTIKFEVQHEYPPSDLGNMQIKLQQKDTVISVDKEEVNVAPGEWKITISHPGYKEVEETANIIPGEKVVVQNYTLKVAPRQLSYKITPDFTFEGFAPEILLDGRVIDVIKPGEYLLQIYHPGFTAVEEKVTIEPGADVFEIVRELQSKPRSVIFDIKYKYLGVDSKDTQVILKKDQQQQKLQPPLFRTQVTPGEWEVIVQHPGFQSVQEVLNIVPGDTAFLQKYTMELKSVVIAPKITYSVAPDADKKAEIVFANGENKTTFVNGMKLPPAEYLVTATLSGYQNIAQKINILPSEKPYEIELHFSVDQREVMGTIHDKQKNIEDEIVTITLNGKQLTKPYLFVPGKEYELQITLKEHEPLDLKVQVPPGKTPFQLQADLQKYTTSKFKAEVTSMEIDGTNYSAELFADSQKINFSNIGLSSDSKYKEFKASIYAKTIRFQVGFYYQEHPFADFNPNNLVEMEFTHISWPDFEKHLKSLNFAMRVSRIEQVLTNDQDKLRKFNVDDRTIVREYLQKLRGGVSEMEEQRVVELIKRWRAIFVQ